MDNGGVIAVGKHQKHPQIASNHPKSPRMHGEHPKGSKRQPQACRNLWYLTGIQKHPPLTSNHPKSQRMCLVLVFGVPFGVSSCRCEATQLFGVPTLLVGCGGGGGKAFQSTSPRQQHHICHKYRQTHWQVMPYNTHKAKLPATPPLLHSSACASPTNVEHKPAFNGCREPSQHPGTQTIKPHKVFVSICANFENLPNFVCSFSVHVCYLQEIRQYFPKEWRWRGGSFAIQMGHWGPLSGRVCLARARHTTFVLSFPILNPGLPFPREAPQAAQSGPQTFPTKHAAHGEIAEFNINACHFSCA